MAVEIIMPKLGLTMKTGTVVHWLKNEGEPVEVKEPLLEIETEKLSYSIESPSKGVLLKILAAAGSKYPIRTVLGYIGLPGEQIPDTRIIAENETNAEVETPVSELSSSHPDSASSIQHSALPTRVFISPVAKKLAADNGIDYKHIKGSGPNNRIVKADVLRFLESGVQSTSLSSIGANIPAVAAVPPAKQSVRGTVIPYKGIRSSTGEIMMNAWTTIPMVTHQVSAGAGALMDCRAMLNAGITEKNDRVTIGEMLLKLTASALALTPIMNSSLTDEGIVIHESINLGMATALEEGLIVPVIRDADRKGLLALSREAKELAARAKTGNLSPDELFGSTFTVSNLGGFGSVDFFTPIINPPQAAILGVGRVIDTAVPVDGNIKIRPIIGLSLTYDHRIIDGATAASFIKTLMELMDAPARAVMMQTT